MDLGGYTQGWHGESVIVFTAAAGWWTDSIEVVVPAKVWMLPELLGISFSANETLVPPFQSTHASYVVHVPSAEVVSVILLFTYLTQLVEASGMTIDESGTSFPPTYESEITVRALTAAGLSRSYEFTVVQEPGLPANAPASPVVTLVSLDAGVLIVTLSVHDKFADQVACNASAGNVSTESVVEMGSLSMLPPLSCTDLMQTAAFLLRACSGTMTRRGLHLRCTARSLSALSDCSHQHRGLGHLWLVWITSPCTSRGLLMDTQPHISCAPRQVRRLFLVVSLRSPLRILWLALTSFTPCRSVPCLALVAASRVSRAS